MLSRFIDPAPPLEPATSRGGISRVLQAAMEVLVLALVVLSPWAFAGVHAFAQFYLYGGLALLLLLWAARMLVEGQLTLARCPATICLAALFVLGVFQLVPLPSEVLSIVSPATVTRYQQFLPATHEQLTSGAIGELPSIAAGHALSVCPSITRSKLFEFLAVLVLFMVVRNNLASPAHLRRLSLVAVLNGSALALFGLVQFFTSRPMTVYWIYQSEGAVFGPFICRNHFAFYINLCLGLGIGLLISLMTSKLRSAKRPSAWEDDHRSLLAPVWELLHQPALLWLTVALALMLSSLLVCLCRGGVLAFLGAVAVILLLRMRRSVRSAPLGGLVLLAALALGLVTWLGWEPIETRMSTLLHEDLRAQDRIPRWGDFLQLVREFPVWGTGYGTFGYVEPLCRTPDDSTDLFWEHAHNEYLEAQIEGGVPRLLLTLALIGSVYYLGYQALRRFVGRSAAGLALGAIFGITAVVLHNIVDFGMHIPAVAIFATVVAAQLCGLGQAPIPSRSRKMEAPAEVNRSVWVLRWGGLAPLCGAVLAGLVAWVIFNEGRLNDLAERYRLAALRHFHNKGPAGRAAQIANLQAAVRLRPDDIALRADLAEAYFQACQEETDRLNANRQVLAGSMLGAAFCSTAATAGAFNFPLGVVATRPEAAAIWHACFDQRQQELLTQNMLPALEHYVIARDLCPLLSAPQLRLAIHGNKLARAEDRRTYLARAKALRPSDPELLYLCGVQELQDGQPDEAWWSWRRSLECAPGRLNDILERVRKLPNAVPILEQVLPDDPHVLAAAADYLAKAKPPLPADPLLTHALDLLKKDPSTMSARDWHLKAKIHQTLGEVNDARNAYRMALIKEPSNILWRYQLAELFFQQNQFREARQELLTILEQKPNHGDAKEMLNVVSRKLAEQ